VFGEPSFQCVSGQRGAAAGDKDRVGGKAAAFGQPSAKNRGGVGGQWGDALFTAFA